MLAPRHAAPGRGGGKEGGITATRGGRGVGSWGMFPSLRYLMVWVTVLIRVSGIPYESPPQHHSQQEVHVDDPQQEFFVDGPPQQKFLVNDSLLQEQGVDSSIYQGYNHTITEDKEGKFIFTVIRFPNLLCGSGLETGTCYTVEQCDELGGKSVGTCAVGYGTCCQVRQVGCGGIIRVNNSWVVSQDYPGYFSKAQTCTYKVYFDDNTGNICQIRYDYDSMELVSPSTKGVCEKDKLVFQEDHKSTYFCGKAPDNYHWYVETAGTTSPHTFTITTDYTISSRRYGIRISTIPCSLEVPTFCGQYFTVTSGTITSYNYNNGVYLAGLQYSICFRKEVGYCTYTLKKTSDNQFIGYPDTLRFMMGDGIPTLPNTALFSSTILCPDAAVTRSTLYYTSVLCLYPVAMTSVNTHAPFFVTIRTQIDAFDNWNTLVNDYSGFDFDWTANNCS